jgi:hypothetical protein
MYVIKKPSLGQSGETIMEVMICIGIVGFMMTSAFTLSNRNQATSRASYERGEAVKIAESQMEKLRYYADKTGADLATISGTVFCIDDPATAGNGGVVKLSAISGPDDTDISHYEGVKYDSGATFSCHDSTSAGNFRYAIWPASKAGSKIKPGSPTYFIAVRWDSPANQGIDQVEMFYEIYGN